MQIFKKKTVLPPCPNNLTKEEMLQDIIALHRNDPIFSAYDQLHNGKTVEDTIYHKIDKVITLSNNVKESLDGLNQARKSIENELEDAKLVVNDLKLKINKTK